MAMVLGGEANRRVLVKGQKGGRPRLVRRCFHLAGTREGGEKSQAGPRGCN